VDFLHRPETMLGELVEESLQEDDRGP
jgi:hypothetical protein